MPICWKMTSPAMMISMPASPERLTCFKAYDVRGRLGRDFDPEIAARIAAGFAGVLAAGRVVLGRDCRASSPAIADAVAAALQGAGVQVLDLGLCGTEEVYFATHHLKASGGIMVTASHNPPDYNGVKLVQADAAPLSPDQFARVRSRAEADQAPGPAAAAPRISCTGTRADYVTRVTGFIDPARLRPLHILVNAGNGAAGPSFDAIAERLTALGAPLRFTRMHHTPDPAFPHGIPNPLLPQNQPATAQAVRAAGADFGVAWDGDFDRCFLFDHLGRFVPGEYVVGLLAQAFLAKEPGATIVHDPRVVMNTRDIVAAGGGRALMARTGHAFAKQALRDSGAVYGGEISAHHYFRDFACCDSGMIPWLLVAEMLGRNGTRLADLLDARQARFPSSGEVNFAMPDPAAAMVRVTDRLGASATWRDDLDGISLEWPEWRFNLRLSNTEPLLRLNVETRGDTALLAARLREISAMLIA